MARVLVVDDEEGIRDFIADALETAGHETVQAADGEAALAELRRRGFHLMITDLRMPRLDGMALVRTARVEWPEMEVIVLTAYGTVDGAVEAMKLGALDYLRKPLSGPDEVRDFGEGVSEGEAERIFEPFHTTRVTGTGLGLAVARRIAELHGGSVAAANHPKGGAVFRMRVPRG